MAIASINPAQVIPRALAAAAEAAWPTVSTATTGIWPGEVGSARTLQQLLLPRKIPDLAGFTVDGCCRVSEAVGGDFYDILATPNGGLLVVIADVMGSGLAAALVAATIRGLTRTLIQIETRPAQLLSQLNELMHDDLASSGMFATAQIAVLDPVTGELRIANAGHCPFLVARHDGTVGSIAPDGIPLGIFDNAQYAEEKLDLASIRCGLLFTDGLTEARSRDGQFHGTDRLREWLAKASLGRRSATYLKQDLAKHLEVFHGGAKPADDQAFVVLASAP